MGALTHSVASADVTLEIDLLPSHDDGDPSKASKTSKASS
jgi:hypothetical protein